MGLNGGPDKYPMLFTGTLVAMIAVSPLFALLVTILGALLGGYLVRKLV